MPSAPEITVPPAAVAAEVARLDNSLETVVPAKGANIIVGTWNLRAFSDLTKDCAGFDRAPREHARVIPMQAKGSDVSLASMLLEEGFRGDYEVAFVISNDSDLVLPIAIVRKQLRLPVGVLKPGERRRYAVELVNAATFYKPIREGVLGHQPVSASANGRVRNHHQAEHEVAADHHPRRRRAGAQLEPELDERPLRRRHRLCHPRSNSLPRR